MCQRILCWIFLFCLLSGSAWASWENFPDELRQAAPGTAELMEDDAESGYGFAKAVSSLWNNALDSLKNYVLRGAKSATSIAAGVILLGLFDHLVGGGSAVRYTNLIGALLVATLSAGDMNTLIGADVIYGDIWASMGEEALIPERTKLLTPFRVTEEMLEKTGNPKVLYMHCLPSFHDLRTTLGRQIGERFERDCIEVTDEVFESSRSIVFEEAENRMHTIKAVMAATL